MPKRIQLRRTKGGGITRNLAEWSEVTEVKANTILTRLRRGWPESQLLDLANKEPRP